MPQSNQRTGRVTPSSPESKDPLPDIENPKTSVTGETPGTEGGDSETEALLPTSHQSACRNTGDAVNDSNSVAKDNTKRNTIVLVFVALFFCAAAFWHGDHEMFRNGMSVVQSWITLLSSKIALLVMKAQSRSGKSSMTLSFAETIRKANEARSLVQIYKIDEHSSDEDEKRNYFTPYTAVRYLFVYVIV